LQVSAERRFTDDRLELKIGVNLWQSCHQAAALLVDNVNGHGVKPKSAYEHWATGGFSHS